MAIYLIQQNTKAFIGIFVSTNSDNEVQVYGLDDLGWGWQNEIRSGDIIELIDGNDSSDNKLVNEYGRIEQVETLTIRRDGEVSTYQIDYNSVLKSQGIIFFLIPTLYFLLCLLLSLILYKNQTNKSSFVLIHLMLLLAIGYLGSSLSQKLYPSGLLIVTFTILTAPILFLHFVYYYMAEEEVVWFSKKNLYLLYIVSAIILLIDTFKLIQLQSRDFLLFTFFILLIIIGWILIKGLYIHKSYDVQSTYKWIINSLIIALAPFVFLYAMPLLFLDTIFIYPEIAMMFIFVIPILFLYLITTGKMYLIRIHIKQFNYFLVLSVVFTLIISMIYYLMTDEKLEVSNLGLFFGLTVLVVLSSFYIKKYLDRHLRTSLFVEKDYYQKSLYRFSESLKDERSSDGILSVFQRELEDVLSAVNVVFHQIDRNDEKIKVDRSYQGSFKKLKKKQFRIGKIIQSEGQFVITVGETDQYFTVCFGTLANERFLNAEELDWLSTLAYYSSVSLENMMEIEELLSQLKNTQSSQPNWVNRLIFNWSEDERRRLAADIHDSFLQDVIILKRRISDLNLDDQVLELEQDLEDIIFSIRETCQELAPPLLSELGLSASLSELIHKANLRSNIHFSININPAFHELSIPLDYKQMIYRTIQELINNAIKHSQAKVATVKLKVANDQVELEYQDNGVGMDPETKEKPVSGMGLLGMQERIRSFNGLIHFESKQDEGLKVTVKVPFNDV